jgi:hypothetical protein
MELSSQLQALVIFIPRNRTPGMHEIGGRVCPRAILDVVTKRSYNDPHQELTLAGQPTSWHFATDWA